MFHPVLKNIVIKNNSRYLKVTTCNWEKYLNVVAPYRNIESKTYNCGLYYNNDQLWCDNCNTNKYNWRKSCLNYINDENLYKYAGIFLYNDDCNEFIYKKIIK